MPIGPGIVERRTLPAGAKGCRTCRIRRVKCDKAFPACVKCTSTGRRCDGYGIWGGGSPALWQSAPSSRGSTATVTRRQDEISHVKSISITAISVDDKAALEWFQLRTVRKTPGMFKSDFWDTLLLQASATEPAVLHGILALSSVHRCGVTLEIKDLVSRESANRFWTESMQHYVEAIRQLRRRASSQGIMDRRVLRVFIITCMVFVSVELLRGQITAAQGHLQSGLGLLREAGWLGRFNEQTPKALESSESVDRWIIEVLGRLHLHDETFNLFFLNRLPGPEVLSRVQAAPQSQPKLPSSFAYMEEAWTSADRLLLTAIHLTQDSKAILEAGRSPTSDQALMCRRKKLQADLTRWSAAFEKSRAVPFKMARGENDTSPDLIQISFNLATILTATAPFVNDEMIYDQHTDTFCRLLDCTDSMVRIYQEQTRQKMVKAPLMSFTLLDICTLPVLYFIVTRCRVAEVRRKALAGLSLFRHRECHWDGWLTHTVARKVVELEQGNMTLDGIVPTSARLRNLRIITDGDPFTTVSLEFERDYATEKLCTRRVVLDVRSGAWSDGVDIPENEPGEAFSFPWMWKWHRAIYST